jgi:adenylate cyclase
MSLTHFLEKELLRAEKRRVEIFIVVIAVTFLIALTLQIFFRQSLTSAFTNPASYIILMVFSIMMIVLLLISRRMILYQKKHLGRLTKRYLWYSMISELFFPSYWLILGTQLEHSASLLDSPILFIYFLLIVVSALHLDFKFSASLGLIIALFYASFTFWSTSNFPTSFNLPIIVYYVRAVLYLLCGVVAGLVASEIKKRLITSYEHLKERDNIEKLFSQQVSPEVVDALKQKQDFSARMQVTIMFLDIRDFTNKVQHLSPEAVIKFQNDFFSPIIEIINGYKGVTNQILGDGLMATFGAPIANEKHGELSVRAAFKIFDFLELFNRNGLFSEHIELGIGMHLGDVIVGNIGTLVRKQFSVSGTPVIIAARLEQLNKELKSQMLISRNLYESCKNIISTYESHGLRKLKGIDEEIEIIKLK